MKSTLIKEIVRISGMEFYAFHGVYPEEATLGRKFTVNASFYFTASIVGFNEGKTGAFVDYAAVFNQTAEVMKIRHDYMEDLCKSLIDRYKEYLFLGREATVSIEIIKHEPPVGGVVKESAVQQEWHLSA